MRSAVTHTQRVLQLVRKNGWLRASDLADAGVPRVVLTRMAASGQLERAPSTLTRSYIYNQTATRRGPSGGDNALANS